MAKTSKENDKNRQDYSKVFSKNLSAVANKLGWSQREFGAQIGVSQAQGRKYLTGVSTPPFETMAKIEKATGVPIAEFFRLEETPEPRVERHELADEIKAAVKEESQENTKLMKELLKKLSPFISDIDPKKLEIRPEPKDKLQVFFNRLLREPGLSNNFYDLVDSGAEYKSLRKALLKELQAQEKDEKK